MLFIGARVFYCANYLTIFEIFAMVEDEFERNDIERRCVGHVLSTSMLPEAC